MNIKSAIESILFLQGEPMAVSRIAKIAGAPKKEVERALRELAEEYRERGIVLVENGEEWQFATNPRNKEVVEKMMTSDLREDLTKAALEILAVVAYKGPISRASIDYIRGVDSAFSLRSLLLRGLVTREENPKDRRSYLYRVSTDLLRHLGLFKLSDFPHYEELSKKEIEVAGAAAEIGAPSGKSQTAEKANINPIRTNASQPADEGIALPRTTSVSTADRSQRRSNGIKNPKIT